MSSHGAPSLELGLRAMALGRLFRRGGREGKVQSVPVWPRPAGPGELGCRFHSAAGRADAWPARCTGSGGPRGPLGLPVSDRTVVPAGLSLLLTQALLYLGDTSRGRCVV